MYLLGSVWFWQPILDEVVCKRSTMMVPFTRLIPTLIPTCE